MNLGPFYINLVNLTPHPIVLNDGRSFAPSGAVARVSEVHHRVTHFTDPQTEASTPVFRSVPSSVTGIPDPVEGTCYIVSAMVLAALRAERDDLVAPSTGLSSTVRNEAGHIASVEGCVV